MISKATNLMPVKRVWVSPMRNGVSAARDVVVEEERGLNEVAAAKMVAVMKIPLCDRAKLGQFLLPQGG